MTRVTHLRNSLMLAIAGIAVAGCVTTTPDSVTGRYAAPIGGAPVISNETPYSRGLACLAGSIPGSDYYLVGGITELNFNIRSQGYEEDVGGIYAQMLKANIQGKAYVMNVGLDLRLVDTKTLEVVDVISYQKQIVGREVSAGVFDILGSHIINVGGGDSALEPVQLAVRSVIERAVLEIVSRLYAAGPGACVGTGNADPLGNPRDDRTRPVYSQSAYPQPYQRPIPYAATAQASIPTNTRKETTNVQTRQNAYSWYSAADAGSSAGLRGGIK